MTVNYIYNVTTASMKQVLRNRKNIRCLGKVCAFLDVSILATLGVVWALNREINELNQRVEELEKKG